MKPLSRQRVVSITRVLLFSVAVCGTSAQAPDVVFFRVVDADTRLPLRGVTVALSQRPGAMTPPTGPPSATPVASLLRLPSNTGTVVRTDADGWFRTTTDDLAHGLVLTKPGYVQQSVAASVVAGSELSLRPGAVLTVRVVDAGGLPVPDARVGVTCGGAAGLSVQADDRGERRLPGLTPGRCRVNAEHRRPVISLGVPGAIDMRQLGEDTRRFMQPGPLTVTVDIRAGTETLVTVTLAAPVETASGAVPAAAPDVGSIRGVVTMPDSRPAAGVLVQATRSGAAMLEVGGTLVPAPMPRAITDARGTYVFTGLEPGSYTVNVLCPCLGLIRSGGGNRPSPVTLQAGQQLTKDLTLERGASIAGRVVDEFGDAEEGASVRVYDETMGVGLGFSSTLTDDRGWYRIALLMPGVYRVSLRVRRGTKDEELFYTGTQPGRERGQVELRAGAELSGVDFRLQPPAGRGLTLPARPKE